MPLYEYECDSCGRRVERIQRFSDPPLTACETCGGQLRKLLSSPAIQFKGSGWYITDYARKPDTGAGKQTDDGAKSSDGAKKTDGPAPDAPTPKEPAATAAKTDTGAAKKSD